jgi:hypothetical protein
MNNKDAILQIAEHVVSSMEPKPYRMARSKEEIMDDMNLGIISGKYEGIVADTFVKYYDDIMDNAQQRANAALMTHQKLQRNYMQAYKHQE